MNKAQLRETIIETLGEIAPEADFDSLSESEDLREALDLDSMDFFNFVVALHKRTGVDIPEADAIKLCTLQGAISYLSR